MKSNGPVVVAECGASTLGTPLTGAKGTASLAFHVAALIRSMRAPGFEPEEEGVAEEEAEADDVGEDGVLGGGEGHARPPETRRVIVRTTGAGRADFCLRS